MEKNKLYVGNLPYSVKDEELKNLFVEFGNVTDSKVITDKFSGRSKGFGFVTFENEDDAAKAVDAMNGKEIEGRGLTVNVAQPMKPRD